MRVAAGAAATTAGWAVVVALLHRGTPVPTVVVVGCLWLLTAGLTGWATRTRPSSASRRPLLVVGLAALVVQLPGLVAAPLTSSDAYRYVWDGRVQLAGTSPYRYAPLDDRLAALRDPVLFPGLTASERSGYLTEPVPTDRAQLAVRAQDDPRTRINRPRVPTIYPPLAQAWFAGVAALTPWWAGTLGLQVGSALLAVAVAVALAALSRRAGRDPLLALWWAWSPLVLLETGNGAHVDVVSAALLVAAVAVVAGGAGRAGRRWSAGVVVGLAASVKLFPLVVVAALTPLGRRRWWRAAPAPVAAVVTLVAGYLPHVLVAGALVLGYLPGYLLEEGGGGRSAVLRLLLPDVAVTPVAGVLLVALGLWALRWSSTHRGGRGPAAVAVPATVLVGGFLLVTTPAYPWYAVSLLPLALLAGRAEWVAVAVAGEAAYLGVRVPGLPTSAWVVASLVVVLGSVVRRRRTTAGRGPASAPTTRAASPSQT